MQNKHKHFCYFGPSNKLNLKQLKVALPSMAHVGMVIHCWATAVPGHPFVVSRNKLLLLTTDWVVQEQLGFWGGHFTESKLFFILKFKWVHCKNILSFGFIFCNITAMTIIHTIKIIQKLKLAHTHTLMQWTCQVGLRKQMIFIKEYYRHKSYIYIF